MFTVAEGLRGEGVVAVVGRQEQKTLASSCFGPTLPADGRHDFRRVVGIQRNLMQVKSAATPRPLFLTSVSKKTKKKNAW